MAEDKDRHDTDGHEQGKMDISEQEKTFEGFIRFTVWGAAISIAILVFLALINS